MLEKMKKFIVDKVTDRETGTIELFEEEKVFVEKHDLIGDGIKIVVKPAAERFTGAYIERGDKETEEFLGEEIPDFLQKNIDYFKRQKNEFMYMESEWFDLVGVDAVSFEVDDVFSTYDVMLGLKLQKKFAPFLHSFFAEKLKHEEAEFDLMFDGNEGLWNVNFALNDVPGFVEELTISEAYNLIYRFLFTLAEAADQQQNHKIQ